MLNKKISTDEIIARLSLKSALFFTWTIPHLDVEGKILGDLHYLKGNVVPYRKDFSIRDIEKCLEELRECERIIIYGNDHKYILFKGFEKNQTVNPLKEAHSDIPDPTPDLLQSNAGVTPGKVNINLSKEKEKEKGETSSLLTSTLDDIQYSWNEFAKANNLSQVVSLSEKRKRSIKSRLKEETFSLPNILFEITQSNFLLGDNERGWKVDFDFVFCSATNYLKIIEGKYRTNGKKTGTNSGTYRKGNLDVDKFKREIATEERFQE